jgi:O-antigen/teichoic acid export membrane protein
VSTTNEPIEAVPATPETRTPSRAGRIVGLSAVYTVGSISVRVLGFALLLVYTRFLTPGDYGMVALAESLAAAFGVLGWAVGGAVQRIYFDYIERSNDDRAAFLAAVATSAFFAAGVILVLGLAVGPLILRVVAPSFGSALFTFLLLAVTSAACTQLAQIQIKL